MSTLLSDKISTTGIKKKKKIKSPLSEKYSKFMNHQNIKLSPTETVKPGNLDEIRINVIKSPGIHKIEKKKPCRRKRVINKKGVIDEKALLANKKCEAEKKVGVENKVEAEKKEVEKKVEAEKKVEEIVKGKKVKSKKKKKSKRKRKSLKRKKTVKNAKKEMEKANKMSDEFIKQELLKSGIEIKGTQKQLMRDIYVFSNLGGIKVRKE